MLAYWPRRSRSTATRSRVDPLHGAIEKANRLESKMCFYSANCQLNLDQLLECMIPANALQALRTAHPFAADRGGWFRTMVKTSSDHRFFLEYNLAEDKYLVPRAAASLQPVPFAEDFVAMLERVRETNLKFRQLRHVIHWLNQNATIGAAKFYFPSAAALLPTDHPFQIMGTRGYHEPKKPISEIANDIREAMETLATALLLPDLPERRGSLFSVQVEYGENSLRSQDLMLLHS
jgi:hypothetical protein